MNSSKMPTNSNFVVHIMLILCLLVAQLAPISCVAASAITEAEVNAKISQVEKNYPDGTVFVKDPTTAGETCFAFAREFFYKLYGASLPTGFGRGTAKLSSENLKVIGELSTGYSLDQLQSLLSQSKPGDVLSVKRPGSQHFVIIRSSTNGGARIYVDDANYKKTDTRQPVITLNRQWDASAIRKSWPVEANLYRYRNYTESPAKIVNQPASTHSTNAQSNADEILLATKNNPISPEEVANRIDAYNRIITAYKTDNHSANVYWDAGYRTDDLIKQIESRDYTSCLTLKPCTAKDRNIHNSGSQCQSNRFDGVSLGGIQCSGFADYIAYIIFGTKNKSDFSKIENIDSVPDFKFQPGDIIRYYAGGAGHSGIVYKVSGDNMMTLNCNLTSSASNNCFITLNNDIKVSTIKRNLIAVYTPKANLRTGGAYDGSAGNGNISTTNISFNSLTTPGDFSVGNSGHIGGSITSDNSPIVSVKAEIHDASTGGVVQTATTSGFSQNTYGPINGSKLDKDLKFESLPKGTYYISYTAKCKNGTQDSKNTSTFTVTNAQSISPTYDLSSFTVTFDANGGYVTPRQIVVTANNMYDSLPTPTRDGYIFLGWNTAKEGSGLMPSMYAVLIPEDVTLYACWRANPTTISFNSLTTPGRISEGNGAHIDGSISTSNSPIISVKADVLNNSTGQVALSAYSGGFSLSTYGPIKGSKIDNDLAFGRLSAGTYYIRYTVTCADGSQHSQNTEAFLVVGPTLPFTLTPVDTNNQITPISSNDSRSTGVVSFNSITSPGNLTVGRGAHIDGTISSSGSQIVAIKAEVINISTGKVTLSAYTNGFSLPTYGPIRGSKLDNTLTFGSLSVGTYYIKYTVTLSDGTSETGTTSAFQVTS